MSAKNTGQQNLFDTDEMIKWKDEWQGMPEFDQEDQTSWKSIIVHFENEADMKKFGELIGQKLTYRTRSIWYPEAEISRYVDKLYIQNDKRDEYEKK